MLYVLQMAHKIATQRHCPLRCAWATYYGAPSPPGISIFHPPGREFDGFLTSAGGRGGGLTELKGNGNASRPTPARTWESLLFWTPF